MLGLIALAAVFAFLRPSTFTSAPNFSNLIHQSAALVVIAMGLVFVLLLGEIDLSAGYAAGTGSAVMGIVLTRHGQPWEVAVLAGLGTGAVIGACIGLLVSRLGIPSFVVTLAAFLGLQGVLLQLIGEGGTIAVRDERLLALNNNNLPVAAGWVLLVVVLAAYTAVSLRRALTRRSEGLTADATATVAPVSAVVSSTPRLSGKDAELETRKKQAEALEEIRKQAEAEKLAKGRQDNCERAKKGQATLKSGVRIALTNDKGEREFMDDTARSVEAKRLQAIAESDCAR